MTRGRAGRLAVSAAVAALAVGCADAPPDLSTRGYVLISLDTVRADRLGAYGSPRPTSPSIDALAARGVLFERVLAPYPSTLVAHLSMFTGLAPWEHRVYPPSGVLPESIATLPERFRDAGFETAGFTEGGFVAGGFGFDRGFSRFDDSPYRSDDDIERTFARGVDFLSALGPEERFFLFLHTYSPHDPYDPPPPGAGLDPRAAEPPPDSSGEVLRAFNQGAIELSPQTVARFSDRYDESIRYVDGVVGDFVRRLEALGLAAETTLVLTSDHGEEFLEHGRLGHTQLFPESLWVPLIVVHPGLEPGRRIASPVELADVAPTLLDLAGLEAPESGRSLVPALADGRLDAAPARAEVREEGAHHRTAVERVHGVLYQLLVSEPPGEAEGTWLPPTLDIDFVGRRLELRGRSFHRPRRVEVSSDGVSLGTLDVTPSWSEATLDLGEHRWWRLRLEPDGCSVPAEVERSDDRRCLSVMVRGTPLHRVRLYDLERDPAAQVDLAASRPAVVRRLFGSLSPAGAIEGGPARELSSEEVESLRALGYLD